jgi:amphi-Trp domain-containing protein
MKTMKRDEPYPQFDVPDLRQLLRSTQKENAAEILSFIAEGLRNGSFTLKAGNEFWSSVVSPLLELSVHFKQKPKGSRSKLEEIKIKLEWKRYKRAQSITSAKTDTRCELLLSTLKRASGGMNLRELEREIHMPLGRLSWPIHKLIKEGLIVRVGRQFMLAQSTPPSKGLVVEPRF